MKIEHKDGYCTECMQYRNEKYFTRHYMLVPTPKRRKCNHCHEKADKPIIKFNRAQVAEAVANRPISKAADSKVNQVFTAKRRRAEELRELQQIKSEHEL